MPVERVYLWKMQLPVTYLERFSYRYTGMGAQKMKYTFIYTIIFYRRLFLPF